MERMKKYNARKMRNTGNNVKHQSDFFIVGCGTAVGVSVTSLNLCRQSFHRNLFDIAFFVRFKEIGNIQGVSEASSLSTVLFLISEIDRSFFDYSGVRFLD